MAFILTQEGYLQVLDTDLSIADLATKDHDLLDGLGDDDHTQYILHSLADAANDFLVASGDDTFVKKTLAETGAILEADLDHGSIQGLGDDDHTIYLLVDGTRSMTGNLTMEKNWPYLILEDSLHGAGSGGQIYFKTDEPAEVARIIGQQGIDPGTRGNLFLQVNDGAAEVSYLSLLTLYGTGLVAINESANANMTLGLTINQGANDDDILCLKSSDVGHSYTDIAEADTFLYIRKAEAAAGGVVIVGFKDADGGAYGAFQIAGALSENVDTTKSSAGRALVEIYGCQSSGGSIADVVADGNVLAVRGRVGSADVALMIVDEDGDLWLGGKLTCVGVASTNNISITRDSATLSLVDDGGADTNIIQGNADLVIDVDPGNSAASSRLLIDIDGTTELLVTPTGIVVTGTYVGTGNLQLTGVNAKVTLIDDGGAVTDVIQGDADFTINIDPGNAIGSSRFVVGIDGVNPFIVTPTQCIGILAETIPEVIQQDGEPATTYPGLIWVDTDADAAGTNVTSFIKDDDGDTMVQVEESADEDIVRIDTGGSEVAVIQTTGITLPLQPGFFGAGIETAINNMVDATTYWVEFTEVYDIGSNWATSTFTCPVDGWYQVDVSICLLNWDDATTYYRLNIQSSNNTTYTLFGGSLYDDNETYATINSSVCAYCDANDTIRVWLRQDDGVAQTDVYDAASYTWCSIRLVG